MTEKEILSLTAVQLGKKIKEKEVTCEEALTAVFAQIERQESSLHCYVTLEKEKALNRRGRYRKRSMKASLPGLLQVFPLR